MKRAVGAVALGLALVLSMTGCSILSDEQKLTASIASGKIEGSALLTHIGEVLNSQQDTQSQSYTLTYRLAKVDRDKSYTDEFIDSENWYILNSPVTGAGYWYGQSVRDNIPVDVVKEYYGYYDEEKGKDGSNYLTYYSEKDINDEVKEWTRGWRTGLYTGLVSQTIDYTTLANMGTWTLDNKPVVKNDVTVYNINGSLSFEEAREWLSGVEEQLDIEVDRG